MSGSPAPTTSAIVGEQQNLTAKATAGPAATYSITPTWTIAGNPITAYPLGAATAPAVSPTTTPMVAADLTKVSPTSFFWLKAGTNAITLDTILNGTLSDGYGTETAFVNTQASYGVQAPTSISLKATPTAAPLTVYDADVVELQLGNPPDTLGISFVLNASVPTGGSGNFAGLQLVQQCITKVVSGTTYYDVTNSTTPWLDNFEFYPVPVASGAPLSMTPTSSSWKSNDNPSAYIEDYDGSNQSLSDSDAFQMYLLYQATGVGAGSGKSIWVPLGHVSWSWNGTTTQNPLGTWTKATGNVPTPTSTIGVGTLPTWPAVNLNGQSTFTTTNNC